jgi:hypothetical protein
VNGPSVPGRCNSIAPSPFDFQQRPVALWIIPQRKGNRINRAAKVKRHFRQVLGRKSSEGKSNLVMRLPVAGAQRTLIFGIDSGHFNDLLIRKEILLWVRRSYPLAMMSMNL